METEIDLYAFWRHDTFPYVLGGRANKMKEGGKVQVPSYGVGYWFTPFLLLPVAEGEELHARLKAFSGEHNKAQRAFIDEWRAALDRGFPQFKKES